MHKSSSRELESEKKRERGREGEEKGNGKKKEIRKEARIEIARDRQRAFGQRAFPRKNPMVESRN